MNAPCKGCTRRTLGCHDNCADYQEFKLFRENLNKARQVDPDTVYRDFKRLSYDRVSKAEWERR